MPFPTCPDSAFCTPRIYCTQNAVAGGSLSDHEGASSEAEALVALHVDVSTLRRPGNIHYLATTPYRLGATPTIPV
jgi:hypothetical protein